MDPRLARFPWRGKPQTFSPQIMSGLPFSARVRTSKYFARFEQGVPWEPSWQLNTGLRTRLASRSQRSSTTLAHNSLWNTADRHRPGGFAMLRTCWSTLERGRAGEPTLLGLLKHPRCAFILVILTPPLPQHGPCSCPPEITRHSNLAQVLELRDRLTTALRDPAFHVDDDLGSLTFCNMVGDAMELILDRRNAGSVFQVASQFNCLEMVNPTRTPEDGITSYCYDKTQGPACAIACPAATLYRNYLWPMVLQSCGPCL
jgi:hypothetical protein